MNAVVHFDVVGTLLPAPGPAAEGPRNVPWKVLDDADTGAVGPPR